MDLELSLSNMIFFISVENGFYNYRIPLKKSLTNFEKDKSLEPNSFLFEYLCYKIVKKKLLEGKINQNSVLISEDFLCSYKSKQSLIKTNAISKKNIIIFIFNKNTQKWNLIISLNLQEQLKNFITQVNKKPISVKIISSNTNLNEDDYILNSTINKLINIFELKLPDDIQFEVNSINISDQPNTYIFLLNFIEGLIVQDDDNICDYIKKLYDKGNNSIDEYNQNYFNSFNRINKEFLNICSKYEDELNEFLIINSKIKNMNINCFEEEKMIENKEILITSDNTELKSNESIIEDNDSENLEDIKDKDRITIKTEESLSRCKSKNEFDMIQIGEDKDLNSDEEEEALKIMERENKIAKSKIREQERKLRQILFKQKLRFENIKMYKEFGVIKEEENESEKESIKLFNKIQEEEIIKDSFNAITKNLELRKSNLRKKNNNKKSIDNNENIIFKTDDNINNNVESKNDDKNNVEKNKYQKSKSEKNIKLSILRELERAIKEFEIEQDIKNNNEKNNRILNLKKKEIKNNSIKKENKDIKNENKNNENKISYIIENKDNKIKNNDNKIENIGINNEKEVIQDKNKYIKDYKNKSKENKLKNKIKKENIIRNDNSLSKNKKDKKMSININYNKKVNSNFIKIIHFKNAKLKEKEKNEGLSQDNNKDQISDKLLIKQKKSLINIQRLDKNNNKSKDNIIKNNRSISLYQNKSFNNFKYKNKNNNSFRDIKNNNSFIYNRKKDQDNYSSNNNSTNISYTNSYKLRRNNSKINNKQLKPSKDKKIKEKENISQKVNSRDNSPKIILNQNKISKLKSKINFNIYIENIFRKNNIYLPYKRKNILSKSAKIQQKFSSHLKKESQKSFLISNKKNNLKIIKIGKNNINYSALDTSINSSYSVKTEEIKRYFDLKNKNKKVKDNKGKFRKESSLVSNYYKNNEDNDSNITIEKNILGDDFEFEIEKKEYNEDGLFYGENITNEKSIVKGEDKKNKSKFFVKRIKNNNINFGNKFYNDREEESKKYLDILERNKMTYV